MDDQELEDTQEVGKQQGITILQNMYLILKSV